MRRFLFVIILMSGLFLFPCHLFAQTNSNLVQQVQAAELLSDLITYTVSQGDARVARLSDYLNSKGKADDFAQFKAPTTQPQRINYMQLYRGALEVIADGKAEGIDQSIASQPQSDLYERLTKAQYYNMHEFIHFNQERDKFDSMRAYLQSAGLYDEFGKSTNASPGKTAIPPAAATPDTIGQRMIHVQKEMKDSAWAAAKAKGESQSDFEAGWPKQRQDYRNDVESRIDGFEAQAGELGKAQPNGTPQPQDQAYVQPKQITPAVIGGGPPPVVHTLPAPVASPYSNGNFAAKDDQLWNMWDFDQRY